jgi:hypothetical protein
MNITDILQPVEEVQEVEEKGANKRSPFDFVESVNNTKVNLILESEDPEQEEKAYNPYLSNRSLSYFQDTVHYANEMNKSRHLDPRLQYEFYLHAIPKKKRYSTKWFKKASSDDLELIKQVFKFSTKKAETALSILTEDQLVSIRKSRETGGVKTK